MAVLQAAKDMQPDQMINLIIKIADFVTDKSISFKKMVSIKKETKLDKPEYIQLAMLLNANRISKLFKTKKPNTLKLSALTSLLIDINESNKNGQKKKAARLEEKDY